MSAVSETISDEEAAKLGLPPAKSAASAAAPQSETITDEEAAKLGLPPVAQVMRVPSPSGWKPAAEAGKFYDPQRVNQQLRDQETNMWGALSSGLHGPAAAMEGPVSGALAVAKKVAPAFIGADVPSGDELLKTYRAERNGVEKAQAQNLKDFPLAPVVGSVLAGGVGQAPTAFGRVLMSALQGGTYGFGSSKADLTKGEVGPAVRDTAIGATIGAGGGLAGEGLNAGAGFLGKKLGAVLQKNNDAAQTAAQKVFGSARGAYGGEVSSAARTLEVLEKAASDPNLPEEVSRQAAEALAGPEGAALKQQVIRSSIGRFSDQLGRLQGARDKMVDAAKGLEPDAVAAAAQARLDNAGPLVRRLRELLPKVILPALGGAVAGPAGAAAGALIGAVSGRSATTVRNALADPFVASRLLGAGATTAAAGGAGISRSAPALAEYFGLLDDKERQ